MTGKEIHIKAADGGQFSAYLASPASAKGPALLVIQEIFGVNQGMRQICDDYAKQGYFAISPDIFWRQEPGVQLTDKSEAEWAKAFQFYNGFNIAKGIADLKTTLAYVRAIPGSTGKAGVTGYCLGGLLTYLMACQSDSDASAAYYGAGIQGNLEKAISIKKPTLLHFAEEDEYIDKASQQNIRQALSSNPLIDINFYPGVNHAFARPDGQHHDAAAAKLANKRTAEFFTKYLK